MLYIPLLDKAYLYLILIHRVLLHLNCVGPQVLLAEIKEKGLKDKVQTSRDSIDNLTKTHFSGINLVQNTLTE